MVTFHPFELDSRILHNVAAAGFEEPTPIQAEAIPLVLAGHDLLGLAQTGTGKTAAFVLPILQRLLEGPRGQVRALILSPTRELAEQTHSVIGELGKGLRLRSVPVYGGVSKERQLQALRRGVEIVVACPGRLLDHLGSDDIDLSHVEVLVLDEADRMFDMGFIPDVRRVLRQLPRERQNLFFCATMPDDIRRLADAVLRQPKMVQIGIIKPAETVSHVLYPTMHHLKTGLLVELLRRTATGRVLVFARTKHRTRNLARKLEREGYRVAPLQGDMAQGSRQRALDGFRDGRYDVLVATDVASRGIDVTEISHVVNYDMPDTVDAYIHRIGRTGRAEHLGEAYTLATEEDVDMIDEIERVLGQKLERRRLDGFDYDAPEPERSVRSRALQVARQRRQGAGRRGGRPATEAPASEAAAEPEAGPQRGVRSSRRNGRRSWRPGGSGR